MAGFEDLIRNALEKSGAPTAERRTAIYNSSRQALERMLAQNDSLDASAVATQRKRLESAIDTIERDYVAQAPAAAQPKPAPNPPVQTAPTVSSPIASSPTPPVDPAPRPNPAPQPRPAPAPAAAPLPTVAPPVAPSAPTVSTSAPVTQLEPEESLDPETVRLEDYPESDPGRVLRERKPYAKLLLWTIILVGIGVAIWWAITFGPAMIKQQLGGSVPNPRPTIESGSFVPSEEEGWNSIFNPSQDAANIVASGRGTADLFQDGDNNFVRLASNPGTSGNTLKIKVPRGVILPLQGKAATFELLMRNPAEKPHQFAIFCEFGAMGNCGRKRFNASNKVEAFIFDVLINNATLGANEEAFVSINSDLAGSGNPLDLFAIRVRPSE